MVFLASAIVALVFTAAAFPASAYPPAPRGSHAHQHGARWRHRLAGRHGQIADRELKRERGGSGLRYSFDIRSHGVAYEVGLDARNGRVLDNTPEGANPD